MAWRSGEACMSQHHNPWMAVKRETETPSKAPVVSFISIRCPHFLVLVWFQERIRARYTNG